MILDLDLRSVTPISNLEFEIYNGGNMRDFLTELWQDFQARFATARQQTVLWLPSTPGPSWLAPLLAFGALLSLALVSGVAVLSLGMLLTSLLVAYLILENVFGVTITVAPTRS